MYFAAANAKPNMTPPSTNNPNTISFRDWKEHESHCGGEHQSPINIESNQASIANYPEFIFHNYDLVFPERLANNGHTGGDHFNILEWTFFIHSKYSEILYVTQLSWRLNSKTPVMNCLSLPVVACPTATTLYSYTFIGVKVYLAVNTELMDNSIER